MLPLLLVDADGIVITSDSVNALEVVLKELVPELRSIGLEINDEKCSVLMKDPIGD